MPTFDTPQSIAVSISVLLADLRITAGDRADTVVEVRPANSNAKSIRAAEQTIVEYADGRLRVKTPKNMGSLFGNPGSIEVDIALPAGSSIDADVGMGELRADGPLGDLRHHTGYGRVTIEEAARLRVDTGAGEITVDRVLGDAEATTGTGRMRIGHIAGTAVIKSSTGGCEIGAVGGTVRIKAADGDISVDRVLAGITAKTACGDVRVGAAVRGTVELSTAAGRIEVGIPQGTAAWLDLTATGAVRNSLDRATGPEESDERVEVRARTHWGDILIHRS